MTATGSDARHIYEYCLAPRRPERPLFKGDAVVRDSEGGEAQDRRILRHNVVVHEEGTVIDLEHRVVSVDRSRLPRLGASDHRADLLRRVHLQLEGGAGGLEHCAVDEQELATLWVERRAWYARRRGEGRV